MNKEPLRGRITDDYSRNSQNQVNLPEKANESCDVFSQEINDERIPKKYFSVPVHSHFSPEYLKSKLKQPNPEPSVSNSNITGLSPIGYFSPDSSENINSSTPEKKRKMPNTSVGNSSDAAYDCHLLESNDKFLKSHDSSMFTKSQQNSVLTKGLKNFSLSEGITCEDSKECYSKGIPSKPGKFKNLNFSLYPKNPLSRSQSSFYYKQLDISRLSSLSTDKIRADAVVEKRKAPTTKRSVVTLSRASSQSRSEKPRDMKMPDPSSIEIYKQFEKTLKELYNLVKDTKAQDLSVLQARIKDIWKEVGEYVAELYKLEIPTQRCYNQDKRTLVKTRKQLEVTLYILIGALFLNEAGHHNFRNLYYNVYQNYVAYLEWALRGILSSSQAKESRTSEAAEFIKDLSKGKSKFGRDKADLFMKRKNEFALCLLRNACQSKDTEVNKLISKRLKEVMKDTKDNKTPKALLQFYDGLTKQMNKRKTGCSKPKHNFKPSKPKLRKVCSISHNKSDRNIKVKRNYSAKYLEPKSKVLKKHYKIEKPPPALCKQKSSPKFTKESRAKYQISSSKIKKSFVGIHPDLPFQYNNVKRALRDQSKENKATPAYIKGVSRYRRRVPREERNQSKKRAHINKEITQKKQALGDITNLEQVISRESSKPEIEFVEAPKKHEKPLKVEEECDALYFQMPDDSSIKVISPTKSLRYSTTSGRDGFLPLRDSTTPPYTLILDLDETLIHFAEEEEKATLLEQPHILNFKIAYKQIYKIVDSETGCEEYFHVRPYAQKLLRELSKYYEVVIFTAGTKDYADAILNELYCSKYISYRLYRHHTINEDEVYVKDLELIGRPIEKTIIVDNTKDNFMYQKENGIPILSWYDDENDKTLFDLTRILRKIAEQKPIDIRREVRDWREIFDQFIQYGKKLPQAIDESL
ncbi:unnamed protein product [Moneuplotes crassus]|uniref:FCP1 homology domain-containing protein n=1 Tax=Euplotes crassus TaxID=5936 RepID=A0AAD1XHL8_EUPCR|nr:unnamed protein product [Moneuplotes crassus]